MKNNSKVFIVIGTIILVGVVILSIIVSPDDNNESTKNVKSNNPEVIMANAEKESKAVKEKEKKDFTNIMVDDYLNLFHGENKEIILIGREGCKYCQIAEPILHKIAKDYNLNINYLSLDNLSQEDVQKIVDSSDKLSQLGTPVLLIVSNDEIVDMYDGMTDTAHYVEFFEKNNFKKK